MMCLRGPKNTNAFEENIQEYGFGMPSKHTITYEGSFNEHKYQIGQRAQKLIETQCYSALSLNPLTNQYETFVGCFLKSNLDGMPRQPNVFIDFVAILDISGSMDCDLGIDQSRLDLAKNALTQLIQIMLPDDRFGLGTFNDQGFEIIQLTHKSQLDIKSTIQMINEIITEGGTTLESGITTGTNLHLKAQPTPDIKNRERRIVMLTDMDDMEGKVIRQLIKNNSEQNGINTSIIAISKDFNAELCDQVTMEKGANYITITRPDQIHNALIKDFHYNFFPAAYDVYVGFSSSQYDLVKQYGASLGVEAQEKTNAWTSYTHKFYPQEMKIQVKQLLLAALRSKRRIPGPAMMTICNFLSGRTQLMTVVNTTFPSNIVQNAKGDLESEGGLILMKVKPHNNENPQSLLNCKANMVIKYSDIRGNKFNEQKTFNILPGNLDQNGEFYESAAMIKGVLLFRYTKLCRKVCSQNQKHSQLNQTEPFQQQNYEPQIYKLISVMSQAQKKDKSLQLESSIEKLKKLVQKDQEIQENPGEDKQKKCILM